MGAGALILLPLLSRTRVRDHWRGGLALAIYAAAFAFAYVALDAGSGALILFAAVQASVLAGGIWRGERVAARAWLGVALAFAGVWWLLAPDLRGGVGDLAAAGAMGIAGVAWGLFTLVGHRGRGAAGPTMAASFLIAAALCLPLLAMESAMSLRGATLAALSGAVTSGLGYVAWYTVAPRLELGGVAAVQLATPVATAALAWPLLDEVPSARLAVAAALVVGGIALTVWRTNGGVARGDEAG